jgi:hypothetical protein
MEPGKRLTSSTLIVRRNICVASHQNATYIISNNGNGVSHLEAGGHGAAVIQARIGFGRGSV